MRGFTIDSSVDAAYLPIAPSIGLGESSENVMIERSHGTIILDLDEEGRLLGVEILGARRSSRRRQSTTARRSHSDRPAGSAEGSHSNVN